MGSYICGLCLGAPTGRHACYTATRCSCQGPHVTGGGPDDGVDRKRGHFAWTATVTGEGCSIGVADRDVAGYSPLREPLYFKTYDEAQKEADRRNEQLGLTLEEAELIVLSSMRAQNERKRLI